MEVLTYRIGKDKRSLVGPSDSITSDHVLNWSGSQDNLWVQGRQYEEGLRQVLVNVLNSDGTVYNLTGFNYIFEGFTPDGTHRIYDSKHGIAVDPVNGQFRFDFPKQAFATAGSYKQAFFRLMKDGQSVTTLEFDMTVLSDMVISGIVPSTYISPLDDILEQYYKKYTDADADILAIKTKWEKTIGDAFDKWTSDYKSIENTVTNLQTQLQVLTAEIKSDQIVTIPMMQGWIDKIANIIANMHVLTTLKVGRMTLADSDNIYPTIHAYIYQYGAGVAQANIDIGGGSTVYDIPVRAERLTPTSINIYIDSEAAKKLFSGFSMVDNPEVSVDGSFAYITSGSYGLAIEAKGSAVTGFTVDSAFKI
ncbi:phage baseplate upper protein [Loigolactobacillus bifermentans]|uniref:Minor capsid protein n=1 Tax=Loigolactobacillus bifermentans DSM 20003 TaxID=1423726 RepID=A0A0R1GRI6_9LACO|nr:phage baseplate upper protein [Loigolactobacillus bifermentans]KRK34372.1 minor capsid protein [Loigolactobacillus bifermentans DSM 20003]QGG60077.1 DUF2479 domain-containing protein [Loigolactobacillus bifermentans]